MASSRRGLPQSRNKPLKLVTFIDRAGPRIGVIRGQQIADVSVANERLPTDLAVLLSHGAAGLDAVMAASIRAPRVELSTVRLAPPIPAPRKFLGLGFSFRSHIEQYRAKGGALPSHQVWFNKQVTAVNGPYDAIHLPSASGELDYEGELALVIGKRARHVRGSNAAAAIAGFMVCNDVSARDWQRRSPTAMLGKSFDTHGPIGPWLTTADEVPNPESLRIRTWVDGELRQDGNTSELIYSFAEMLEELSTVFTLEPGDILATGTPAGAGSSFLPPRYLTVGQSVRVEVEGLGHIENLVVPEPQPARW
jgi:2-keto-4-pentenoate hydratase/2-oxohepta-3-ene-1,7-dioic acid hydratase in catechol pathway